MLSLTQSLSLNTTKQAVWLPSDETSVEAWFRKATKIGTSPWTDPPLGSVTFWVDSTGVNLMAQSNAAERPTFANEVLTFDGSDNLQGTQISLTGDYTVGVKLKPTGTVSDYAVLGDNTTANHFIILFDDDTIRVKSGGSVKGISITDGSVFSDGGYFVLTRDSSNFTLYWNGVQQEQVAAVAGTQLVDTIGGHYSDAKDYVGDISEIQIYSSTSAALTNNINTRLATL